MPIITQADLATNIYAEIITEITRSDTTIADRAITAAVQEAKMYLNRYDLLQLFGIDTSAPAITDEYLKSLVKDLACWHLLRLSNTGVDYTAFRTAYTDAITSLKNIQSRPGRTRRLALRRYIFRNSATRRLHHLVQQSQAQQLLLRD